MTLELRVNFKAQGWAFGPGDEMEIWRDGEPLGALTAEAVIALLQHHVSTIEVNAGLRALLPGLTKPTKRLPEDRQILEALAEPVAKPRGEDLGF